MRSPNLLASFRYAFEGIAYTFRTQRNFKIHTGAGVLVLIAGLALGLSTVEWAVLVVVMGLVFQAELVNTAIEALTDRASPDHHPLAKVAKDCAAAGVLITAIAAVLTGALILGARLLSLLRV